MFAEQIEAQAKVGRGHLWLRPDNPVGLRGRKCCDAGYLAPIHWPTWGRVSADPVGDDRARARIAYLAAAQRFAWTDERS